MAPRATHPQDTSVSESIGSTLPAYRPSTLLPPSPALRRLLLSLSKPALVSLVLQWLSPGASNAIARPSLSNRKSSSSTTGASLTILFLDMHESRRCTSLYDLRQLWQHVVDGAASKATKTRAVDRILEVDWSSGISYEMVAQVACEALRANVATSKTWTTAKLVFDDDSGPHAQAFRSTSPQVLRSRLSAELSHYFTHHLYLDAPSSLGSLGASSSASPPAPNALANFTHMRLVLPPSSTDVCAGTHILLIPASPWVLLSGSLGRAGGARSRSMLLSALAQATGAASVLIADSSKPAAGVSTEDETEETLRIGELKGKDALSLYDVLMHGSSGTTGGGAGRAMRAGTAEDGPLVRPAKRRRDTSAVGAEAEEDEVNEGEDAEEAERALHPATRARRRREKAQSARESEREVAEVFGQAKEGNVDLPKLERLDYELHLATPGTTEYVAAEPTRSDPIRLRLQGTHVLAGLRSLVAAGADRKATGGDAATSAATYEDAEVERRGVPLWLAEPSGTRIVVRPADE